ncbi:MAG: phage holin [Aminipila sp.]
MKINWKLRLKNKTTCAALIGCSIAFVYQILGILGITAPISEDQVTQVAGLVINLLGAVGVLVDPTTKGANDSRTALTYNNPN